MKKLILLSTAALLFVSPLRSQNTATGVPSIPNETEVAPNQNLANAVQAQNPNTHKTVQHGNAGLQLLGGPPCLNGDAVGSASNMFTTALLESNSIVVNNELNTVLFIHRNNAGTFGGSSGNYRYDLSTNGGATWTSNQGVVNPLMTFAGRYPEASIYNPPGNTDPNNAYLVYQGATLNGANFDGIVSGVRKLDGTGNTENYQYQGNQTLVPRAMIQSVPGTYWSVDYVWTGAATTGIRIFKGDWNGATDVVWTINTTFSPSFNTAFDGTQKVSKLAIAFDPTGQIGYVCALTHLTPGPVNYAFYPVFWNTTDGGLTWSGPEQIDLNDYPCVTANITLGNTATTLFDMDLVVDVKGNPHAVLPIGNGDNAYAVFLSSWHHIFDVTKENGLWNLVDIANVNAGRTTFGTAPNMMTYDTECQASRSDDGTKVFFFWEGSDVAIPLGGTNANPNLWGMGYNVINREWSAAKEFTSCNGLTAGKIYWPKASPNSLNIAGGDEIPVAYGAMTSNDPALTANFNVLDSVYFMNTDYVNAQCSAPVSITQGAMDTLCFGDTISITGVYEEIQWSDGTNGTTSIAPTVSGRYYVAVRSNCCIGIDSIDVVINNITVANFSSSTFNLHADFTDLSANNPTSWFWDFGDGNVSAQQNPSHTWAIPGTYNVCLIATNSCGVDTFCQGITVYCAAAVAAFNITATDLSVDFTDATTNNPTSWAWDFGDGNTSTSQNPTNVYVLPGNYNVCLIVTDSCGVPDTTCQSISVTCPAPNAAFSTTPNNLVVDFTDLTGGFPSGWSWGFGDGGTSTSQNPSHTYLLPGSYVICLSIADTCGTDTVCQLITVSCPAPGAAFSFSTIQGTANFTDLSSGSPNAWSWDFGDGGNSTSQNPTHTYAATGVYNVCLVITDTCGTDSLCQNVTVTIAGTNDIETNYFIVYPNPSQGTFYLENKGKFIGETKITFINPLGQTLFSKTDVISPYFRMEFELNDLSKGIYLLKLDGEGVQELYRVVIE